MNKQSPRAGRREWIGLAVIALPCMLYSMDLMVLDLALPALSAGLQPGATALLCIADIYGFSVAGLLITIGTLGDRRAVSIAESPAPLRCAADAPAKHTPPQGPAKW
jgi:DHA2 family multidrug resistance protein-like MFS transporter